MIGTKLLAALEGMILERVPDGRFVIWGDVPSWFRRLGRDERIAPGSPIAAEDMFPFLSAFLPEAEQAWRYGVPARLGSDLWTEVDVNREELHLEATAVRVERACLLIIMRNDRLFLERQTLLQRARELRMTHSSLMKEIEHKDILVHAIVHDLAAPLHSIMGVLSLLGEQPVCEPSARWIRVASQAADRQRELISEILDVFSAEGGELAPRTTEGADLVDVIDKVITEREPVAGKCDIRLHVERPRDASAWSVVADPMRLFRVLTNLVDNAIRHSPAGGVVSLTPRRDVGTIVLSVEDQGPGVPPDVLPRLFEKFARGREVGAGTGLGLFYCRITVENWGGGIGYEPGEEGGARFWIRLRPMPEARDPLLATEERFHDGEAHAGR